MNTINPYRRNCEILRRFFSKPIILLLAIAFCISTVSQFFIGSINFLAILPIIAFFMFYLRGKSGAPHTSFKTPCVLLKVYSIILIVLNSIMLGISALSSAFLFLPSLGIPAEITNYLYAYSSISLCFLLPNYLLGLLFHIALLTLVNSFNRSQNTIYLHRKGSKFLTVMGIILAVYCIGSILTLPLYDMFTKNVIDSLNEYTSYMGLRDLALPVSASNIFTIVAYAVQGIVYTLFAILGISYNSYIKKVSTSIGSANSNTYFNTAPQVTAKNTETDYLPLNMWDGSQKQSKPVKNVKKAPEFKQPQPVNFDPKPVSFTPVDEKAVIFDEPEPIQDNHTYINEKALILDPPTSSTDSSIIVDEPLPIEDEMPVLIEQPSPIEKTPAIAEQHAPIDEVTISTEQLAPIEETPVVIEQSDPIEEAPAPQVRYCHKCGKKCPADFVFCSVCGTKLQ